METTEMYTRADPSVKLEALEAMIAPTLRSGRFKATDKLIAELSGRPVMRSPGLHHARAGSGGRSRLGITSRSA